MQSRPGTSSTPETNTTLIKGAPDNNMSSVSTSNVHTLTANSPDYNTPDIDQPNLKTPNTITLPPPSFLALTPPAPAPATAAATRRAQRHPRASKAYRLRKVHLRRRRAERRERLAGWDERYARLGAARPEISNDGGEEEGKGTWSSGDDNDGDGMEEMEGRVGVTLDKSG